MQKSILISLVLVCFLVIMIAGCTNGAGNTQASAMQELTATQTMETVQPTIQVPATMIMTVPAFVRITPETINLGTQGFFIAFVRFSSLHSDDMVDVKTITCSGAPAVRIMVSRESQPFYGFVFATQDLKDVDPGNKISLNVTGLVRNKDTTYSFSGSDVVTVVRSSDWLQTDIREVSNDSDDEWFNNYSP
jgi:hypothetical protein